MTGAVTASRPDRRPVRSRSTGWSCCAESVPQGARHLSATSSERARRAGEADKQQRTEAPGAARPSPLHQARKAFQSAAYGLRRPSAAPPAAPSMSRPGVLASMPQARTARPIVTRSAGCSGNSNRPPGSETAFQRFMTRYTDTVVGVLWRLASRASAPAGAAAWSAWPRRAPVGIATAKLPVLFVISVAAHRCGGASRFGGSETNRGRGIRSILVRGCPQIWGFGDDVKLCSQLQCCMGMPPNWGFGDSNSTSLPLSNVRGCLQIWGFGEVAAARCRTSRARARSWRGAHATSDGRMT